jgi:proteasome lid subunit RPN8/RPN11
MIRIHPEVQHTMEIDALQSFPDECCGFLFGTETNNERQITDVQIVHNAKEGDKRRRFEISAKDYLYAERYADKKGLQLLGVYHSHPSVAAIPSEHDRLAAQPFFSYVILSAFPTEIRETLSWRLNDHFQFEPEALAVEAVALTI